jgi:hypothetical protein
MIICCGLIVVNGYLMMAIKKNVDVVILGQKTKSISIILLKAIFIFIILILVLFAGFREIGFDRDSLNYAMSVQSIDFSNFSNFAFFDKEPSFYVIAYLAYWLFGDAVRGTFVIYALLGVTLKMAGIYKLSRIPLLSIILYVSSYYLIQELTLIRVGVASAIFLHAIPDIVNKDGKAYLTKTILASLFHYSALIMLPLYLIHNTKLSKRFYFFLPLLGMCISILFDKFIIDFINTNISLLNLIPSPLSHKLFFYLNLFQIGIFTRINIFSLYYLSWMIIYYFCVTNINKFKSNLDIVLIKILGFALFIFYSLSFLPVLAYRISEILGIVIIILLPSIVYVFKRDNRIIIIIIIIIYSLIGLINILFIQKYFNLGVL